MDYELELPKIVKEINAISCGPLSVVRGPSYARRSPIPRRTENGERKTIKVLLQLPDGLKPRATELVKILEKKTKAKIYVWAGSNYGACDVAQVEGFDLIINFGHASL